MSESHVGEANCFRSNRFKSLIGLRLNSLLNRPERRMRCDFALIETSLGARKRFDCAQENKFPKAFEELLWNLSTVLEEMFSDSRYF